MIYGRNIMGKILSTVSGETRVITSKKSNIQNNQEKII